MSAVAEPSAPVRPQVSSTRVTRERRAGTLLALALLALLNALPFVSLTSARGPAGIKLVDVATFALVATALLCPPRHALRDMMRSKIGRFLMAWSAALVVWWAFTVARSVIFVDVPPRLALLYGRDFLYLAVLVPLLVPFFRVKATAEAFIVTLAIATVIFDVAEIGAILGDVDLSFLLHSVLEKQEAGLLRLYVPVNDLITLSAPIALGAAVAGPTRTYRRAGAAVAALSTVAVLLQLTRAVYLGLAAGTIIALTIWLSASAPTLRRARRRWFAGLAVACAALVVVALFLPSTVNNTAVSGVTQRVSSTFGQQQQSGDTLAYRGRLAANMRFFLGADWPIGLGFVHPDAKYFEGLPTGQIRNPDVGVLNAVMTMGFVGAVLIYLPLIYLLARTLHVRFGRDSPTRYVWFYLGFTAWGLFVLISSPTLVILFWQSGLALTAFVLALTAALLTTASSHRETDPTSGGLTLRDTARGTAPARRAS